MNKFLSYLEKQAATYADVKEMARLGRTHVEERVAKEHGKEAPKRGFWGTVRNDLAGETRAIGRGLLQGAAGAAAGIGAGHLLKSPTAMGVLGLGGWLGAGIHGSIASAKNQINEMHKKYSNHEKKAAYDALLESGYDFESATAAIEKEAGLASSAMGKLKNIGGAIKADAGKIGGQFNQLRTGKTTLTGSKFSVPISSGARAEAARNLAKNKAVQAGAGAAALAAAGGAAVGSAMSEKKACIELLMNEGIDFYTAVELTKQAEMELAKK